MGILSARRLAVLLSVAVLMLTTTAAAAFVMLRHEDPARVAATGPLPLPTAGVATSAAQRDGLRVTAWLPYWDGGAGLNALRANSARFDSVHLFWYQTKSATEIELQARKTAATLDVARKADVEVIATVTEALDAQQFQTLLNDEIQRKAHVSTLCALVVDNDYDGIDLDYEKFSLGVDASQIQSVADAYVGFVEEVAACLHPKNKRVEVTVISRWTDSPFSPDQSLASGVYDYERLGTVADVVRIMAYDLHYSGSEPGPVAPLGWVNQVLHYATSRIDPAKLEVGIPSYGYDWEEGGKGTAVTASAAPALAARHGVAINMDAASRSMFFDYTEDGKAHHVWFDDTATAEFRVALAQDYGIRGVAFWALGHEDPSLWR